MPKWDEGILHRALHFKSSSGAAAAIFASTGYSRDLERMPEGWDLSKGKEILVLDCHEFSHFFKINSKKIGDINRNQIPMDMEYSGSMAELPPTKKSIF